MLRDCWRSLAIGKRDRIQHPKGLLDLFLFPTSVSMVVCPFAVVLQEAGCFPEQKADPAQGEQREGGSLDYFNHLVIGKALECISKRRQRDDGAEDRQDDEPSFPGFRPALLGAVWLAEHEPPKCPGKCGGSAERDARSDGDSILEFGG